MSDQQQYKAYVGNLPNDAIASDIEELLRHINLDEEEIRKCDIHLCHDRETGRFKGFSYVTFMNEEQLNNAIENLNYVDYGGRTLKVNRAQSRGGSSRGGRGGNRGARGGHDGGSRGGFRQNQEGGRGGHGRQGGNGGRGGQRNRFRKSQSQSDDHSGNERSDNAEGATSSAPSERPKLVLQPRTTDPAALEAKKKREEEETAKRQAKIFG